MARAATAASTDSRPAPLVELGVYAVYPSRKFVSPKVGLMIEFLAGAFRMRAWPA